MRTISQTGTEGLTIISLSASSSTEHTQTVSKHIKDNTVLFSLRDMIFHFRDCLGH